MPTIFLPIRQPEILCSVLVIRNVNLWFKDMTNPCDCMLKMANFSIKTSNEKIVSYIIN